MSVECIGQARIHTTQRSSAVLLLLVALIVQLCTTCVSSTSSNFNFSSHAEREQEQHGDQGELPVPSYHYFTNMCSDRMVQFMRRKKVDANGLKNDKYSELLISSVSFGGLVTIQHAKSKRYLCFNKEGKLKVKHSANHWCVFEEISNSVERNYMYRSHHNTDFYLGFNKSGKKMIGTMKKNRSRCYTFLKSSGSHAIGRGGAGGSPNTPNFNFSEHLRQKQFRSHRRRHDRNRDSHQRRTGVK